MVFTVFHVVIRRAARALMFASTEPRHGCKAMACRVICRARFADAKTSCGQEREHDLPEEEYPHTVRNLAVT
eukprot:34781-Eustigmatos_ZCMA.PRE.1